MTGNIPTYRLYRQKVDEEADFWLHSEDLPFRSRPNRWEIDRHRHQVFFQLFTILAGGGEVLRDGGGLLFSAPCVIIIPTGSIHGFRFEQESDGIVLTILADRLEALKATDRRLADFFSAVSVVSLAKGDEDAIQARECLASLREELDGKAAGRMALVDALLSKALVHLARAGHAGDDELPPARDRDVRRIERLVELVDAHFREHPSVDFFAGRLGLSPTHLNRLARQHLRETVQSLLARKLITEARRALTFTTVPAKTISFDLGFSDPAYFTRFFRKKVGTTPRLFRLSAQRRDVA